MEPVTEVFKGLGVVDFSWSFAGPMVGKYLGDHGATVIRVESPKHPCITRVNVPYKNKKPGFDRAGYFAYLNANKLSLTLDLRHPRVPAVTTRLMKWADVVIDSFTPGTLDELGLGYEKLRDINPRLIMFRTSAQGQTGPHARHPGYGMQLAALAGFPNLVGWPDASPLALPFAYTDMAAARFGGAALVAALIRRLKTGRGQLLDVSQLEASLHYLGPLILDREVNDRENVRDGNACDHAAPHGVYRCKGEDRWCAIAVFTDAQWQSLCRAIGDTGLASDSRFATLQARKRNEEELAAKIEAWSREQEAHEVMATLQKAGVPAGVVNSNADIFLDPQLKHRNHFWMMQHREIGEYPHLGQPFILSDTPARAKLPAPCMGEHNIQICREILGIPEQEMDELILAGVFY